MKSKKKIPFGCHPFINSQPFIYPLLNKIIDHDFNLIFDTPSGISEKIKDSQLDLAFLPSIEYAGSNYLLVPDHSISSKGKVESVLLFSKKPVSEVKTVALDSRSKTSIAMLKILLQKKYKNDPTLFFFEPNLNKMIEKCDSALIIGDKAIEINRHLAEGGPECEGLDKVYIYDLGEEWYSYTNTVFVHAILVVRAGVDLGNSPDVLKEAKKIGLSNIEKIAAASPLAYDTTVGYLKNSIRYDFNKEELKGLENFFTLAMSCGIIKKGSYEIRFYDK